MYRWDDIKFFLAVARSGSTLAAKQATGTSQSTAFRRIAALEAALELQLFDRLPSGRRLTDQGEQLLAAARDVEEAAERFLMLAQASRRQLTGTIRVTMPEGPVERVLTPPITAFRAQHPHVRIEVIPSVAFLDIAAGEADVAIRSGERPTDPRLVARLVGESMWTVYGSRSYIEAHGCPRSPAELIDHSIIGPEGALANAAAMRWLAQHVGEANFACRGGSIPSIISLVRAGLGIALLPITLGDGEIDLLRCFPPPAELTQPGWLVTRDDVRRTPHVRAFLDFLTAHLLVLQRTQEQLARAKLAEASAGA